MFVGDSLNRGQWISLVCLLQSVIPADKRSMSPNAHLTVFRAEVICYSSLLECVLTQFHVCCTSQKYITRTWVLVHDQVSNLVMM